MSLSARSTILSLFTGALLPIALLQMEGRARAAEPVPPPLPSSSAPVGGPTAAPGAKPVTAPDVIRLKSGGMLRGTISELVPGGDVVLITVAGDMRRVPMS